MGTESNDAPPLPAPTEESSESTLTQTELATSDLSKTEPADDKSYYSLPEDGSPVTIKTRGHKPDRSQTSLLIEYFEGGKPSSTSPTSTGDRRPAVRVRLTPSKNRKADHIQITETKSSSRGRKASLTRRQERAYPQTLAPLKPDDALSVLNGDREDAKSMHSYTSATEESNVSRNPIEVDTDRSNHHRRRRPASPLIPATDSRISYQGSNTSDISAIPTDSFLDGSGGSTRLEEKRGKSPARSREVIGGASAGLGAAAAADRLRSKSRSELSEKERSLLSKSRERDRSERRHKSKHRKSSGGSDHHSETGKSSRKRPNKGIEESILSGADSSVISSALSHSHRSLDASSMQSGATRSSINNPKLLETVEDAIRRLILPELSAIKREQSKRESRRTSLSSGTASRDDLATDRRQSGYSSKSRENLLRGKDRRDREAARHELIESPAPSVDHDSVDESLHEIEEVPRNDKMKAAAAGGAVGAVAAAAKNESSPAIAREQRRRRRAEAKSRVPERLTEDQEEHNGPAPPMPLLSEVNPSKITRTSIQTAETDRPRSASEEPIQQVARGTPSVDSSGDNSRSTTPTRNSVNLQALGTQHANISHGDLKTLSQKRTGGLEDDYEEREHGHRVPIRQEEYDDDEDDDGAYNDYYNTQDVPPPLKYVPYQPERRGLSPIPSVSGFTEGGSEVHNRDSRLSHMTSSSFSSPDKSIRYGEESPSVLSRGSYQDDHSMQSSRGEYRNTTYTDDSELDRVTTGQAVRAVGANPDFVNSPHGVDSHVASLVEGSALDESVLTGDSGRSGRQYGNRGSQQISEKEAGRGQAAHHQQSFDSHRTAEEEAISPASEQDSSRSQHFDEYDLDEYGRKVPRTKYRHSPTASEAAITGAAVGAAAAALKAAAKGKGKQPYVEEVSGSGSDSDGGHQNKSFMERTKEGFLPKETPTHSVERLVAEFEKPRVGHSGLPDLDDPMPEIGFFNHGDNSRTTLSRLSDQLSATRDTWQELEPGTPTQESMHGNRDLHEQGSHLSLNEAAGAAAVATAAAMAHSHSRQTSQDVDEEWHRTSEDRKRDTIVTNPYEGTSPLANAPGLDIDLGQAPQFDPHGYVTGYGARSPYGPKVDEGYISQGPNRTPDFQGKGMDYSQQPPLMSGAMDPYYNQQDSKHMSGLSEGLDSPMYDAAMGTGIDSIESKDIIALMQHLMVRDAQRSARDTEILVTLVRTAAEMRNSFDDIKKMLADTEDTVITEVKDNTERTVQRHIGGPRPFPGSGARSIQGSQGGTDNEKKTRNLWRRALKGLGNKGTNDLTRIEDMLMQLLSEVDVLKEQTAHGGSGPESGPSMDNIQPAVQYEQDHGYEPEGHAGTSTASYASQSGHLSIPRNASGYEARKVSSGHSGHRISTVPEGDEEDYPEDSNIVIHNHSTTDMVGTGQEPDRGSSAPRASSPQRPTIQTSFSNENTPRTDKGKKHKSNGSSSWFPKISRWSETTASSVGKAFRKSKEEQANSLRGGPSRSGSDLATYDDYPVSDPYLEDFLHSGLSETSLPKPRGQDPNQVDPNMQFTLAGVSRTPIPSSQSPVQSHFPVNYSTPEDPKYKAHRNSVNLQHPQPRPPQTEQYRNTLETSAQEYDAPMSPKSADFGSVTSLSRFTGHQPTFSNSSAAGDGQYTWGGRASPAPSGGPPRPPKEPLEENGPRTTTPTRSRISNLAYKPSSSPKPENRNLQNVLAVPGRRPSGPRAMGSKSPAPEEERRRRKRDTFGTVTSQESDTF